MLNFNVITLFPELFLPFVQCLPLERALTKKIIDLKLWNLRNYASDKHGTVDDKPYGGGTGMILMVEPIYKALQDINRQTTTAKGTNRKVVLLSPGGERFTQQKALELSKCDELTLICGRYEGVDARVENLVTDVVSIGDYVLSGGELPALVILESVTRLLPGVLEKESALTEESFNGDYLEYPQYTRPEIFEGMQVPEILLSGNHEEIRKWREGKKKRKGTE